MLALSNKAYRLLCRRVNTILQTQAFLGGVSTFNAWQTPTRVGKRKSRLPQPLSMLSPFPSPSLLLRSLHPSLSLLRFSSRPFNSSYSNKAMADHRTPDARRSRRGWGGFYSSGPGHSSSGKSSTSNEECSSSFRNRQTSTETKSSSNVIGLRSDNESSSGKSSTSNEDCSSSFRNRQTSTETKSSSNVIGLRSDNEVSSGKSNVHNEDRTSRSSSVTDRNKSPQRPRLRQSSPEMVKGSTNVGGPESKFEEHLFDICSSASNITGKLKKSFLEINRERKREREQFKLFRQPKYLRSGMVLLKNYISLEYQETIIKSCRELGIGKGGFYQPGYKDGAKLHLKMMCLGKDWDPESRTYGDYRSIDGARPPEIPDVFRSLVEGAIKAAHDLIRENTKCTNVEYELPKMSPEICIVNFYNNTGKLGLHQDRDESPKSIAKGVPIVSFSVGDSAEFLYGDKRDVDTAEKLVLDSGDVLIFGGKSRCLFHGVSSILPNTAPKSLIEETKLKPGRLNLTFRQL